MMLLFTNVINRTIKKTAQKELLLIKELQKKIMTGVGNNWKEGLEKIDEEICKIFEQFEEELKKKYGVE